MADKIGYYRLELVVKDEILASAPDYVTISVSQSSGNLPPVAVVGPNQALVGVNSTGLDGSGSSDPDWDSAAWPDPDQSGVYRKGLGYDWSIISKPTGSTASIACTTAQSPAWDCPNPKLTFNGYNGTYVIGLKVIDAAAATSDQVAMTVTVTGIPNVAPVAVASPKYKVFNFANLGDRTIYMNGSSSYDPLVSTETLTYSWSIVQKPAGSTAALENPATATPSLAIDREGQYKVHLKVCDSTAKCSCAWGETRAGDAYCNKDSVVTLHTTSDTLRVSMPAGWPQVGQPGGSGGTMSLLMGYDQCQGGDNAGKTCTSTADCPGGTCVANTYDKPLIMTVGFSGFFAAVHQGSLEAGYGPFKSIISILRSRGYDVWWLTYDPVCSGGATPNTEASWGTGGQDFCASQTCACPYPQQPVDNHMSLNAVVLAYATQQAKNYGACAAKTPDDPTDPCFVRVFGPSMGGVIGRFALAWAQDGTKVTVPYASGESAPYVMNGMRAKPTGKDVWDLGARVLISGDSPQQGANIPVSLQALIKGFEAATGDPAKSGGPLSGFGFKTSGAQNMIAWAFLKHKGLRNWFIDNRGWLTEFQEQWAQQNLQGLMAAGAGTLAAGGLLYLVGKVLGFGNPLLFASIAGGVISGFLQGLVAGLGWAIIGAIVQGLVSWAVYELCALFGPYGWVAAVVYFVLDFFFGIGSLFFSVKTSFDIATMPDSKAELSPFMMTPVLNSPAAKELLNQSVTGYATCPDVSLLLQGQSVPNRWPAGFGKDTNGRVCKGSPNISTTAAYHDQFYAFLNSLNGGRGYPTNVRNVGMTFGSRDPGLAPDNNTMLEIYLPYVIANQAYPTYADDHLAGSGFGPEVEDMLLTFKLHLKGVLTIKKRVLFWSSTSRKTLFDDSVKFPREPLLAGALWPFIPTQSAADLVRPAGCGTNLPCCQILPTGTTPHPQEDAQRNCCRCTTKYDATLMSGVSLLHVPELVVNPCMRGKTPGDPFLEALRTECVAPDQTREIEGVQRKMCPGDETVYLFDGASGYACGPEANEVATRAALELFTKAMRQLDTRPTCADAQATFVCHNGQASCPAAEGLWVWVGGWDRDGDGCPGQTLPSGEVCATYCETDAQDQDSTYVGNPPQGNTPPTISAVSAQQSFALPTCYADSESHTYGCMASVIDAKQNQLVVSVTASDPNGDPLTYVWEFLPDASQGQSTLDVSFSNAMGSSTKVAVMTQDKPPQGTYRLRVTVRDNKGGSVFAETSVVVPGDAPPQVSIAAPAGVREICEYQPDPDNNDAWRCYADLTLTASASDPDGPDQTSIILVRWEDLTDRETSAYKAVTLIDDPYALAENGLMVYISEAHAATPEGYPLKFRVTAVDVRGQQASAVVELPVCLDSAPTCP